MDNAHMDNALVAQKDEILRRINSCEYADELHNILDLVNFLAPLWDAVGYGYKTREIKNRIKTTARYLAESNVDFLKGERKNSRVRRFAETQIERLEEMASAL